MKRRSLFGILSGMLIAPLAALKAKALKTSWNGYLSMMGAESVRSKPLSAVLSFEKTGGLFIYLNDGGKTLARIGNDGRVIGGTCAIVISANSGPHLLEDFDRLDWLEKDHVDN